MVLFYVKSLVSNDMHLVELDVGDNIEKIVSLMKLREV